ncbi:MAG: 3-isopropylmalate dehydratase small subunit [Candidatus Neomarinimicrobiota bacterium]
MEGNAHVYQNNHINTDEIIPARYLNCDQEAELAGHAMEDIDVDFLKKVKTGDFIVSGDDFGCGSSREHAVWALRGAGIRAVIANSFARIFYRNCINNGFPAIECPGAAQAIRDGDRLEIDLAAGQIVNLSQNQTVQFRPLPDFAREMIAAGGLMAQIKKELK